MWQTDTEPTHSFAKLARQVGVKKARMQWEFYAEQHRKGQIEAHVIEQLQAREAAKRDYRWNDIIEGEPVARFHARTYMDLYRASLPQRGCKGGEYLNDEDFMKFFLKRNEQCAIKAKSPHIRDGWTPALEHAAFEGRKEREARLAAQAGIITSTEQAA
jgi:hypothetical protein